MFHFISSQRNYRIQSKEGWFSTRSKVRILSKHGLFLVQKGPHGVVAMRALLVHTLSGGVRQRPFEGLPTGSRDS